jgi:dTDP-4-dehydrorhamnose reductase
MTAAMARVLILGADGQLGTEFRGALASGSQVFAIDRADVDISDASALTKYTRDRQPTLIVNCAAFNDVDGAEHRPLDALYTNAFAVETMARLAGELDATLVHFSSDFVFDGEASRPYREADSAHPLSVYAMSKWLAEVAARLAPRHYVLRLSSLYGGPQRRSFIDRIAAAVQTGQALSVFSDRIVSPSYTLDVVRATVSLVEHEAPSGIYHCGSSDHCSWYELACEIARHLGVAATCLRPVPFVQATLGAVRPRFCALSSDKLAGFGGGPRRWSEAVRHHLARYHQPAP